MKKILLICFILCEFLLQAASSQENKIKVVLFPIKEATIAAQVDGTLKTYSFQPGQKFKQGEQITSLDDRRWQIEKKKTQEQYDYTRSSLEEQKELLKKNFSSDSEVKKKEFELSVIENSLEEVKLNLSYCLINAPFSGKIEEILTKEHETVRNGQPLFKIIDDHQLLAVLNIPIAKLKDFSIGTQLSLNFLDNQITIQGQVYEIMPRADHRSGTIQIKVLIDNAQGLLTAGMTGELADVK